MNMKGSLMSRAIGKISGRYEFTVPYDKSVAMLNALNAAGAVFHGARIEGESFVFCTGLGDYGEVMRAASSCGAAVAVSGTSGLPFLIYRYRKRPGMVIGMIIAMVLVFCSMMFVWEIRITGNSEISEERIIAALRKSGLTAGTYIPGINESGVSARTILTLPDLSSVSVVIKGTYADVDVIERVRPPEAEDGNGGLCDICATRDGVIVNIAASSGKVLVKPGETVCEGQTLVTGLYDGYNGTKIAVRSSAVVLAETYRSFCVSIPFDRICKRYTGRTDVKTSVSVLGYDFELFFGALVPYDRYDAETSTERVVLFGSVKTPVIKTVLTTREYVLSPERISENEALIRAKAAFNTWLEGIKDGEVLSKSYTCETDVEGGCLTLIGEASVLTDIAAEAPFSLLGK